jgi:CRP/FNR family cyclic AMP-dependent transcriptional regulator
VRIGKDAKTELLKNVPLFSGCTKQELQKLAMIADEIDLRDGAALTREGQAGREFFVLIEGTVDVIQGEERVAELGAGDWVGEIALLTNAPRTATVTATSPVRVLVVTDRAFRQVVETTPSIAVKMLERVGERLAHDARSNLAKAEPS